MEDIFEEVFRAICEGVLELLLKGPGYLLLRYVFRFETEHNFDGAAVLATGFVFWALVGGGIGGMICLLS